MSFVRKQFRRLSCILALCLSVSAGPRAEAGVPVFDATQTASNLKSSMNQIAYLFQQLNIDTSQLEWYDEIMDAAQGIYDLVYDVGLLERMYKALEFHTRATLVYTNYIMEMRNHGLPLADVNYLVTRVSAGNRMLTDIVNLVKKILADSGLSKSDKLRQVQEATDRMNRETVSYIKYMSKVVSQGEARLAARQFDNFLSGRPADYVRQASSDGRLPAAVGESDAERQYTLGEAFGSQRATAASAHRSGLRILSLVMGIFIAISFISAYAKFSKGKDTEAFFRVFVVIAVVIVFYTCVGKLFNI